MQKQVLEHNTRGIGAPTSRSLNVSDDLGCFSAPPIVISRWQYGLCL